MILFWDDTDKAASKVQGRVLGPGALYRPTLVQLTVRGLVSSDRSDYDFVLLLLHFT